MTTPKQIAPRKQAALKRIEIRRLWIAIRLGFIELGYARGQRVDEIARAVGTTPGSVKVYACNTNIGHARFWTVSDTEALCKHWAAGLSCKEISAKLPHHSPFAVAAKADRLGLIVRSSHATGDRAPATITLAGPEWSWPDCARRAA